jgi:hypothetical protein
VNLLHTDGSEPEIFPDPLPPPEAAIHLHRWCTSTVNLENSPLRRAGLHTFQSKIKIASQMLSLGNLSQLLKDFPPNTNIRKPLAQLQEV